MASGASEGEDRVRTAELVGALCLATDLGMGFPFEHGLQSTLVATRLAERLEVDSKTAAQTYYACLLSHAGCTTDAHVTAEVFGGSMTENFNPVMHGSPREVLSGTLRSLPEPGRSRAVRAAQVARGVPKLARVQGPHLAAMCEVAGMLADGMGLPADTAGLLRYMFDRWDGKGPLRRAKGEEIPLPMRIVNVAVDANFQRMLGGAELAVSRVRERAGGSFDPAVADCFVNNAGEIVLADEPESVWDEVLRREPAPSATLGGEALDRALATMGNFADLMSPFLTGHSTGVADLAAVASERCRLASGDAATLHRAALVHDVGRAAIGARVWQKPGPLNAAEWEEVRLHPYHTERVLARSPFLSELGSTACAHHERLDGSGYHRGASGAELPVPARLLAASDAYHAMTEPRPHREALPPELAARKLADGAEAGRFDADGATAVIEAAGQPPPRLVRAAGLTDREAEVVGLLARGLQTKQIARELEISAKTADRHIQNAYGKIGVSTRAGATLFAMEHGLVAWGELPIAQPARRS